MHGVGRVNISLRANLVTYLLCFITDLECNRLLHSCLFIYNFGPNLSTCLGGSIVDLRYH